LLMQVNGTRLPSPRTSAHPLNGILPLLIAPLITIIIKGLKKPAAHNAPAAETKAAEQR